MDAGEFLNLILPDDSDGLRVAFVQQQKRNYFFTSNDELAAFLTQWDAAGYTVYHACASYKTNENRKATNVQACASLWCDIDAGPDKPYADSIAAQIATNLASDAAGLPRPLLVFSGMGLHAYWPFAFAIPYELWLRYARGLRAALIRVGLQFDPTRICDAASILRTPGTTHRKAAPKLVLADPKWEGEPYANQLFDHLLKEPEAVYVAPTPKIIPITLPAHLIRDKPNHVGTEAIACRVTRSASVAAAADRCKQLQLFRDWRVIGPVSEAVWYASIGVCAFADDGDECAHKWDEGYPSYSYENTQKKLDYVRAKLSGPTTCAYFQEKNPKGCAGCPFAGKITTPLTLGAGEARATEVSPAIQATPLHLASEPDGARSREGTEAPPRSTPTQTIEDQNVTLPEPPRHFAWRGMELCAVTDNKDGQASYTLISTYAIFLDGMPRHEISEAYNLHFKQWLPYRGWFTITISAKVLFSQTGSSDLASAGANIHDWPQFLRYVRAAIDKHHKENKVQVTYEQYGWKHDNTAFLYGPNLYTNRGIFAIPATGELKHRNTWIGPGANAKGAVEKTGLENWKEAINALFAQGCEAQSIALLASFAAALMRFCTTDEGGAIISLVTRQSGIGKTVALAGASSVWGDRQGLSLTNEDNRVTKGLTLKALGNLPIIHDELQTRDPEYLREFVITFTNGRDKMRASREGQIKHSPATWQTLLITASNSSLVDALQATGQSDAPSLRVLEIPMEIPANLAHQYGDKLKNDIIRNAGYAGDVYARYIVQPDTIEWIKEALAEHTADIWERVGGENKHRFWVRAAACITVAATIVKTLGLIDYSGDRVVTWLIDHVAKLVKETKQVSDRDWSIEALGDFMLLESANILVLPKEWIKGTMVRPLRTPVREIVGCYMLQERKLAITVNRLRSFAVEREIPFREWMRVLTRKGAMGQVERKNLSAGTDIPGAMTSVVTIAMSHPELSGLDANMAMQPDDDTTNVVPIKR